MSLQHRKRQLEDLNLTKTRHSPSHFPSLFSLAVKSCVHHIQIFATFDGLPFDPFGKAILNAFLDASTKWRLTTEQRQVGILLLSEAYGDLLGPEYTGLQCGLPTDIPFLDHFSHCLVYLDLSDASDSEEDGSSLTDSDMAGLSCLSHLRILDLSGLKKIGDTGLSHLVRSVSFGSGPVGLEYLNLAGTDVTDQGLAKLYARKGLAGEYHPANMVFKRLLGLDVTGTRVQEEATIGMFPMMLGPSSGKIHDSAIYQLGWKRLDRDTQLFPTVITASKSSRAKAKCYLEPENNTSPIKKWVDRFNDQPQRLVFGQKPDLAGKDGLGLSECLALAKMGQLYLVQAPDSPPLFGHKEQRQPPSSENQSHGRNRRGRRRGRGRFSKKFRDELESVSAAAHEKDKIPKDVEEMYNLIMYQRILDVVRVYFHAARDTQMRTGSLSTKWPRLAFVRSRSDVDKHLHHGGAMGTKKAIRTGDVGRERNFDRTSTGSSTAKIRSRADGEAKKISPHAIFQSLTLSAGPKLEGLLNAGYHEPKIETIEPNPKRIRTLFHPAVKKEDEDVCSSSSAPFGRGSGGIDNNLPTRRKRHGIGGGVSNLPSQPFLKPKDQISMSNIYFGDATPPQTPLQTPFQDIKPVVTKIPNDPFRRPGISATSSAGTGKKPASANLMKNWIQASTPSSPTPKQILPSKAASSSAKTSSPSITREFHYSDKKKDAVSLHRWIREGAAKSAEKQPGQVVRIDPREERQRSKDEEDMFLEQ
ncbi:hypothetical protein BG005_005531 [Podila minutissima]|nr:hypothetical protein BG005_005531 [Podila minutissima]